MIFEMKILLVSYGCLYRMKYCSEYMHCLLSSVSVRCLHQFTAKCDDFIEINKEIQRRKKYEYVTPYQNTTKSSLYFLSWKSYNLFIGSIGFSYNCVLITSSCGKQEKDYIVIAIKVQMPLPKLKLYWDIFVIISVS